MDAALPAAYSHLVDPDLPPPRRPRDGRHGGADPDQERPGARTRRRMEKVRADKLREVARPATTAPGSRTRAWCALAQRGLRRAHAGPEPDRAAARGRARSPRPTAPGPAGPRSPRRACARTSTSASSISKPGCAASGCVPLYNLMEDAATAEISRAQVWQWMRHGARLEDGRAGHARALSAASCDEELAAIRARRSATTASRAGPIRATPPRCSTRLVASRRRSRTS